MFRSTNYTSSIALGVIIYIIIIPAIGFLNEQQM
jgi:hypothetical protein